MTKCYVKTCNSSDRKHSEGVTFHKIPKNLKKQWLEAIKRPTNILINYQRVCSLHFSENDFEKYGERKRLKTGTVPSENLPQQDPLASPLPIVLSEQELARDLLTEEWVASLQMVDTTNDIFLQPGFSHIDNVDVQPSTSQAALSVTLPPTECDPMSVKSDKREGKATKSLLFAEPKRKGREKMSSSDSSSVTSSLKRRRKIVSMMHNYSYPINHYEKQIKAERKKTLYYKEKLKTVMRISQKRRQKLVRLRQVVRKLQKKILCSTTAREHLEQCKYHQKG